MQRQSSSPLLSAKPKREARKVLRGFGGWVSLAALCVILAAVSLLQAGCGEPTLQPPPEFLFTIKPAGEFALNSAEGLAVGLHREMIIADTGDNRLLRLRLDPEMETPQVEKAWGEFGANPGQFFSPYNVAVDPNGDIYVTDSWNHRVQKFSADGRLLGQWGKKANVWDLKEDELFYPRGIAVDYDSNVYVVDSADHRIIKYSPQGKVLKVIGEQGQTGGRFQNPVGIAAGAQGDLYITDAGNSRLQRLSSQGEHLNHWGQQGRKPGEFKRPSGVAVDDQGRVYVVDSGNHRVQVFDSSGKLLTIFGQRGSGAGELESPESIAIGEDGKIYVLDWGNNRIQVFRF
jgi:sugar lactone lactonase YvrE